jgi:hypothetical protein
MHIRNKVYLSFAFIARFFAVVDARLCTQSTVWTLSPAVASSTTLATTTITTTVTMSLLASRTSQVATRVAARRMSTTPKLHKAKDQWTEFVKTRPPLDVSWLLRCCSPFPSPSVCLFSHPSALVLFLVIFCLVSLPKLLLFEPENKILLRTLLRSTWMSTSAFTHPSTRQLLEEALSWRG